MKPIHIERDTTKPAGKAIYWLREEGETIPYAYIERVGNLWWLGGLPHLSGYFPTRNSAIAEAV